MSKQDKTYLLDWGYGLSTFSNISGSISTFLLFLVPKLFWATFTMFWSRNCTSSVVSGSMTVSVHFGSRQKFLYYRDFWIQKLQCFYCFCVQKLHHCLNFWTLYILSMHDAVQLMKKWSRSSKCGAIPGYNNCKNLAISWSKKRKMEKFLFVSWNGVVRCLDPEMTKILQFLDP